jgi:hypothetical protein
MNDHRGADAVVVAQAVRMKRIRQDARRTISVNLAETIELSHQLIRMAGSARKP